MTRERDGEHAADSRVALAKYLKSNCRPALCVSFFFLYIPKVPPKNPKPQTLVPTINTTQFRTKPHNPQHFESALPQLFTMHFPSILRSHVGAMFLCHFDLTQY